jgi:predicted DNA-binding transcriptional regulator AlpA
MARPEVTGQKVEHTTDVECTVVEKKERTRKRKPLPPRRDGDDFTISEWCQKRRVSESMFFKMKTLGIAPRQTRIGRRVTITAADDDAWQRAREAASA